MLVIIAELELFEMEVRYGKSRTAELWMNRIEEAREKTDLNRRNIMLVFLIVSLFLVISGCTTGMKKHDLPYGYSVHQAWARSASLIGPQVANMTSVMCSSQEQRCNAIDSYTQGAEGVMEGLGKEAVRSVGFVWGMSALRPPKYNNNENTTVTQEGGGAKTNVKNSADGGNHSLSNESNPVASSDSSSNSSSSSHSSANPSASVGNISNQQQQNQNQRNDNRLENVGSGNGNPKINVSATGTGGSVGDVTATGTGTGYGGNINDINFDNGNNIKIDNRDTNKNYNRVDVEFTNNIRNTNNNRVHNPPPPRRPPMPPCGMPPCGRD